MKTTSILRIKSILFSFFILTACFRVQALNDPDISKAVDLFEKNRFSEAREILEEYVRMDERNADAWFNLGRVAMMENRLDDAEEYYKKAIKLNDAKSEYHQWLGRLYGLRIPGAGVFRQPFLARNTRRSFETAVELNPDNLEARFDLLQFYAVAPGIIGGSLSKAREQAEELKKRDALYGHAAYGFIYNREDEFEKAEREFIAAREVDPANPDPYFWLAILFARQQKHTDALEVIDMLLQQRPDHMPGYYQFGRFAAQSGTRLEEGMQSLEKYLTHTPAANEPSHAWTHFRIGNIYERQNDPQRAREHYQIALEIDPGHSQAREALRR